MSIISSGAEYPFYVAGKAQTSGQWLEVQDKYQQSVYARVALADGKVLEQAIAAALKAEAEMAALKPFQKQKILLHCVKRFNELRDELTEILIAEGGKPRMAASAEVERLINTFQLAADAVTQLDEGRMLPLAVTAAAARYRGMVKYVPIGAVSLISPFNFPLNLVAHKIAPAIAAKSIFLKCCGEWSRCLWTILPMSASNSWHPNVNADSLHRHQCNRFQFGCKALSDTSTHSAKININNIFSITCFESNQSTPRRGKARPSSSNK